MSGEAVVLLANAIALIWVGFWLRRLVSAPPPTQPEPVKPGVPDPVADPDPAIPDVYTDELLAILEAKQRTTLGGSSQRLYQYDIERDAELAAQEDIDVKRAMRELVDD